MVIVFECDSSHILCPIITKLKSKKEALIYFLSRLQDYATIEELDGAEQIHYGDLMWRKGEKKPDSKELETELKKNPFLYTTAKWRDYTLQIIKI